MSILEVLRGERQHHIEVCDVLAGLRMIPDNSVQCCVTSPPYYGLRDYGLEQSIWGGDPACEHLWGDEVPGSNRGGSGTPTDKNGRGENYGRDAARGSFCRICNAWRGCFGLEPTPQLYVEHSVLIFREVRRVLRDDGTFWLNIGDSYCSTDKWGGGGPNTGKHLLDENGDVPSWAVRQKKPHMPGIKPKDLIGIPWMVAFALRDDGWWLRSEIIWQKPNAMPDSCEDRPTKSHEQIFLLTKSATYFYDHVAIFEPFADERQGKDGSKQPRVRGYGGHPGGYVKQNGIDPSANGGKNKRSVWNIPVGGYRDAHFATFPIAIPETCLKAGTSLKGCCAKCGAPYERVTDREQLARERPNKYTKRTGEEGTGNSCANDVAGVNVTTVGWQPTCECNANVERCVCLDPFNGAATTGLVAVKGLNLRYIGLEKNPEYAAMSERRITAGFSEIVRQPEATAGQLALFGDD